MPTQDGMTALAHMVNAYESHLYKREYDLAHYGKNFSLLDHVSLFEPRRLPTVAVSSLCSLDDIVLGDDVARVSLNVFPTEDGIVILFSFLNRHARHLRPFLEPFQAASGDRRLQLVSARILNSCENFVLAPNFWNGLTTSRQKEMTDFYASSVLTNARDLDDQEFMLFSPENS